MPDVLMVLFEVLPDGNQQVISSQTFGSRDEAIVKFDEMTASIFVGPGCHEYQIDLVDRASITELVQPYIPNTEASIEYGNALWVKWKALKTGDIAEANLGGDFTNSHPVDSDCRVPTPTVDDFKPTLPGDGPAPAVPLSTASVSFPAVLDPLPAPTTATGTTSALAALPAVPLPETGGNPEVGSILGGALLAAGVICVSIAKRVSTRHSI